MQTLVLGRFRNVKFLFWGGHSIYLKLIEKFPKTTGILIFFPLLLNYGRTKACVLGEQPIKHQIREYNFIILLIKRVLIVNFKLLRDLAGPLLALVFKMNRQYPPSRTSSHCTITTASNFDHSTKKTRIYICSSADRNLLYL